jgi:acyl carrier protein
VSIRTGLNSVREVVVEIVSECAGERVAPNADLWSLGLSSLSVTRMLSRLEDELGLRVPALLFFECDTLDDLVVGVTASFDDESVPRARPPIRRLPRTSGRDD